MATTTPEPAATRAEARKLYAAKFAKQLEAIDKKIRKAASSGDHGVLIDGYGFESVTTSQTRQSMPEEPAAIMAMLEERGFDVQVRAEADGTPRLAVMWGYIRPSAGSAFIAPPPVVEEK